MTCDKQLLMGFQAFLAMITLLCSRVSVKGTLSMHIYILNGQIDYLFIYFNEKSSKNCVRIIIILECKIK